MADLRVAVELAGRDNGASSTVNAVAAALHGLTSAAAAPVGALSGLVNTASKLGMGIFGIKQLAEGLGGLASGFVAGNAQMETYETQLGTLMGSAGAAKDRLAELAQFGATTPFELPEVVRAEKVLLGFGLTGEKVFKLTGQTGEQFRTTVGDIAAGTGASFEEIALTMGKFSAGATGEAMARFQEMGIATREQLAGMGVEFSKSGELLSPLPVAMTAITKLTQQKFGGGMDQLSKTFSGQVSTLMDNFGQMQRTIAQPIFDVLKDSVAALNTALGSSGFQAMLQRIATLLAEGVKNGITLAVEAFYALQAIATNLAPVVQMLWERFTAFFGGLTSGVGIAATVNAAFGDLIPAGLNPILDAVDSALKAIWTTVAGLVASFQQGGLAAVWAQVTAAMQAFAPTGERISAVIETIRAAIVAFVPQPIQDFVTGLVNMGTNATSTQSPMQTLAGIINTVSAAVENVTRFIKDNVAVQAALVGILTAAGVAWGISAAVNAYSQAVAIAQAAAKAYTAVQLALNLALTANPIGLVVMGLAALAAALIYAYNNSETFRKIVDDTFAVLKRVVLDALDAAGKALELFQAVAAATGEALSSMGAVIGTAIATVKTTVETGFKTVTDAVENAQKLIQSTISSVWDRIPGDIKSDLNLIYNNIVERFQAMQQNVSSVMESIQGVITTAWGLIQGLVEAAVEAIRSVVEAKWMLIQSTIDTVMGAIQKGMSAAWEVVRAVIEEKLAAAIAVVLSWQKQLQELLAGLRDTIYTLASQLGQAIIDGVKASIAAGWAALESFVAEKARGLLQAAKDALGAKSPSKAFMELGDDIIRGLAIGIQNTSGVAKAAITTAIQAVIDTATNIAKTGEAVGAALANAIGVGIGTNVGVVWRNINDFTDGATKRLTNLSNWINGWMDDVAAKRTELLRRFNFAAYVRGEGVKVIPELRAVAQEYEQNVQTAFTRAGSALAKVAADFRTNVEKARADARASAQAAVDAAGQQVAQLIANYTLQHQIQAQRDAFAEMQRQQKAAFDTQQNALKTHLATQESIYRIAFQAQKKLQQGPDNPYAGGVNVAQRTLDTQSEILRVNYEAARDTARATTKEERTQIAVRAAEALRSLEDQQAEERYIYEHTKELRLNLFRETVEAEKQAALQSLIDRQQEELYVASNTATLRGQITDQQAAFDRAVVIQTDQFNAMMEQQALQRQIDGIYAERDARIAAIQDALTKKEAELQAAANTERNTILSNLKTQLEDYQTQYIDKVVQAFHHAQVDIADFIGTINNDLKNQTQGVINDILKLAGQISQLRAGPQTQIWTPPATAINPMTGLPGNPLGQTTQGVQSLPGGVVNQFNLTVTGNPSVDTAQQIADVYRRIMIVAG